MSRADNVNCATHHSARSRTRARQSARPDAVSCHHTGFHCSLLSARRQPTRARKRHTSVHARFTVHFGAVRGCGFGGLYSSHPVAWPPRALDVGVKSSQVGVALCSGSNCRYESDVGSTARCDDGLTSAAPVLMDTAGESACDCSGTSGEEACRISRLSLKLPRLRGVLSLREGGVDRCPRCSFS